MNPITFSLSRVFLGIDLLRKQESTSKLLEFFAQNTYLGRIYIPKKWRKEVLKLVDPLNSLYNMIAQSKIRLILLIMIIFTNTHKDNCIKYHLDLFISPFHPLFVLFFPIILSHLLYLVLFFIRFLHLNFYKDPIKVFWYDFLVLKIILILLNRCDVFNYFYRFYEW